MKKLSIILALIVALGVFAGCARRTASDLDPGVLSDSDSVLSDTETETEKASESTDKQTETDETDEKDGSDTDEDADGSDSSSGSGDVTEESPTDPATDGRDADPEPVSPSESGGTDEPIFPSGNDNPGTVSPPSGNGSSNGGNSDGKQTAASKQAETSRQAETSKQTGASKQQETSKSQETSKQTGTPKQTETTKSAETSKQQGTSKTKETSKSAETSKQQETAKQQETSKSAETSKQQETAKQQETTKQPETTKPPEEPKPQSDPKLPATAEIYPMNGGNVAVVNVKNATGHDCSVEVKATYKKADGSAIRTETKRFSGLSAGDDNNFIFNPGISFASVTCETKEISDGAAAYTKYVELGDSGETTNTANFLPASLPLEYRESLNYMCGELPVKYTGPVKLYVKIEWIMFDNTGKASYTGEYTGAFEGEKRGITCKTDLKCNLVGGTYVIPDNFKGTLKIIAGITYASEESYYG